MAVTVKYVVEYKGVEKLVTTDKRAADQYDKMLDTAEHLAALITDQGISMDQVQLENLSIALSTNKDAVAAIFRGKSFDEVKKTEGLYVPASA